MNCDPVANDSCVNGVCTCSSYGTTCPTGYHCTNLGCVCDAVSCPNGCCPANNYPCRAQSLTNGCGVAGAACTGCDTTVADGCTASGACGCGGNAACASGSYCKNGACVCDATSCSGCCAGGTCVATPTAQQCGSNGSACVACPNGLGCTANGTCGCDSTTCTGCCNPNGTCQAGLSNAACGKGGQACAVCGPVRVCDQLNQVCVCPNPMQPDYCPTANACLLGCSNCSGNPMRCPNTYVCAPSNCAGCVYSMACTSVGVCTDRCIGCAEQFPCFPQGACVASCAASCSDAHACSNNIGLECVAACDQFNCPNAAACN
jgi:hypothetical protein